MNKFISGFKYAFRGILYGIKTGMNQKIHLAAAVFAVAAGIYTGLSDIGYCVLALVIAGVFSAELFNSAIEALSDEVCGGSQKKSIEVIKDMSAGAVLIMAIASVVTAYFLFIKPFLTKN